MALLISALICSVAVVFAGVPSAVNEANRIHIENGREPNAGVSIAPVLIIMFLIWCGAGFFLRKWFGATEGLLILWGLSLTFFLWQLNQARRSNRQYQKFLEQRPNHLPDDCT